jgi:hypothetical protein
MFTDIKVVSMFNRFYIRGQDTVRLREVGLGWVEGYATEGEAQKVAASIDRKTGNLASAESNCVRVGFDPLEQ